MACNICQKVISDDDGVTCRGFCGNSYHMLCVRLDLSHEALEAHRKNLFWFCDGCADTLSNDGIQKFAHHCNHDIAHDNVTLQSLKDDICGLKEVVNALTTKFESKSLTPSLRAPRRWIADTLPVPNTPKRIRDDGPMNQPNAKPCNIRGTKTASELVKTVAPPEDLLWIYLSAFHPSTSENDIVNLVRECMDMGTDAQPKVVRLVPKDKDPATLSYVTFKVGVSKALKEIALSMDTWPDNIFFREFDNSLNSNRRVLRITASNSQSGGGGR